MLLVYIRIIYFKTESINGCVLQKTSPCEFAFQGFKLKGGGGGLCSSDWYFCLLTHQYHHSVTRLSTCIVFSYIALIPRGCTLWSQLHVLMQLTHASIRSMLLVPQDLFFSVYLVSVSI